MKCLITGPTRSFEFEEVRRYLERSLQEKNIDVITNDENIENLDIIIADISENDPNVFYVIGYAHALKKALIPIVKKTNLKIPSNLQGTLYFVYDKNELAVLSDQIIAWIKMYVEPYKLGETKI